MMCQVFNHLSKRSLKYQSSGRPQALTSIWGTPESAPAVPPLVGLLSHHGVHVRQCPVQSAVLTEGKFVENRHGQ